MKKFLLIALFALVFFTTTPALFAQDDVDHSVKLTFDKPVEIPGQTLAPGTYLFAVSVSSDYTVRVYDEHRQKLYATLDAVPATRIDPVGGFQVKLADGANGTPALMGWFNQGATDGYELLYPRKEMKLLTASERTVKASDLSRSVTSGD